jgi:endo-1,4-beta-xylanase
MGTAIAFDALLNDPLYAEKATQQFNSFTPENLFKADLIHPQPNVFNWVEADSLVAYARIKQKRLHGHPLIWHQQLPQWMQDFEGNAADWEQLMKTHIQTIVRRYQNQVQAWDVVNEAFNEDGTLRHSIWRQKLGDGYIEKAFAFAHEADPNALLFYNDYNLESNPTKLRSALKLFNQLRLRGIKVDGIGVQMHINTFSPTPSQIAYTFQEIAAHHYQVHVSELDISLNPMGKELTLSASLLEQQAQLLGSLVAHYNQLPTAYQYGITFWGITDRYSWIRSFYNRIDYPLLYDDHYQPKPCYCQLKNSL